MSSEHNEAIAFCTHEFIQLALPVKRNKIPLHRIGPLPSQSIWGGGGVHEAPPLSEGLPVKQKGKVRGGLLGGERVSVGPGGANLPNSVYTRRKSKPETHIKIDK